MIKETYRSNFKKGDVITWHETPEKILYGVVLKRRKELIFALFANEECSDRIGTLHYKKDAELWDKPQVIALGPGLDLKSVFRLPFPARRKVFRFKG